MIPLPTGNVPETADVVIIGAGINGLALAYELGLRGVKKIVVVEKNYIGSGSTGRCGGGIRQQWTTKENIRLAQESVQLYQEMATHLGYQTFFRQGGYLMVTEDEKHLSGMKDAVKLQNSCDVATEFMSPEDCLKVAPGLNIENIKGASFCSTDGTAYPFAVVWGYAKAVKKQGTQIFLRTELTSIETVDGKVTGVTTSRGKIATPLVVNCAGPWARTCAEMVGVTLPNKQERHEIMVSEPLKPFLDPMIISLSNGIYFSQSMRGEIVGGIGDPTEPEWESADQFDTSSQLRFAVRFAKALTEYHPSTSSVRMMRQWAGMYDVTPDHRPILGGVDGLDGYQHICGFSGHGFMLAPVTAHRMADSITTGEPDELISSLSLDRFANGETVADGFVVG